MRHVCLALAVPSLLASLAIGLQACGNGDDNVAPVPDATTDGAGADAAVGDATADADGAPGDGTVGPDADADAAVDAHAEAARDSRADVADARDAADAGDAGDATLANDGGATPVFLAHFDLQHLPEGLWLLNDGATPVVGFTQLATLATVDDEGGTQVFGVIDGGGGAPPNTFTLGITTDPGGNVYAGVGSFTPDAGPVPPPGIYRFPPGGGPGALLSTAPGMNFPNGLDFVGGVLLVADSEGTIFAIDPASGTATPWSTDPLLAPDTSACDGGITSAIGANGIVHDANNNVLVTNSDFGRIVSIPMNADGGAGAATTLVESCSALAGADGLVVDPKDGSLLVAVNAQNKIVRVTGAQTTVVTSGPPLDFPASVVIQSQGASRRLLFTNAALFSGDAGQPGLLALPLP